MRDEIGRVQSSILRELFDTDRLARMANNEFKTPAADGFTQLELFRSVQSTVWSELASKANITPLHRDLQRSYLDLMIGLTTGNNLPADTKMLAWDNLRRLKAEIALARKGQLDAYTRLHLDEAQNRIQRVLDAKTNVGA